MISQQIGNLEFLINEEKILIEKIIEMSSEEHLLIGDFLMRFEEYFSGEDISLKERK